MAARKTIALLVDYLSGDYQTGLCEGAGEAAHALDVNLLCVVGRSLAAPNAADAAQSRIYRRLGPRSVDGVVVGAGCIGIYAGVDMLSELCRGFELPACSIGAELPEIPSLVVSNRSASRSVTNHLIEAHGVKRILYVRGPLGSEEAQQRLDGYRDALEAHGIEFTPELVEVGNFWIQSGQEAIERVLARGLTFDAVVAANDYMALGAVEALRAHGKRVPHDLLVAGFDDVRSARSAFPSLTTVRQPLRALGRSALETVCKMIEGEKPALRVELDVELVTRQSCGCAYRVRGGRSSVPPQQPALDALSELRLRKLELTRQLETATRIPSQAFGGWAIRLLDALADELSGMEQRFLLELEGLLEQAQAQSALIDEFNTVIGVLRAHFRDATVVSSRMLELDDIWHAALLLIGGAANRSEVRMRNASERAQEEIRSGVELLSTAFDHATLIEALRGVLSSIQIASTCLSLYEGDEQSTLRCLFAHGGDSRELAGATFSASELLPAGFWSSERRSTHILMPVTFATEQLGLVTFEVGASNFVYAMLREQIGAALKGAALHRAVVQETRLRERADHERLEKEALIAKQIQTAILPLEMNIPGLELAAQMAPAYEVGGDYYDVLRTESGCWLGIGDVTGHGLLSGLVMLMIQSMVAGMVASNPQASPRDVVIALNDLMLENVRHRLARDEHATVNLIRYERDGSLVFAGYHEDLIICRKASGVCERIATQGLWLGAIDKIAHLIVDTRAQLLDGDLLVLYTDGVIEALNARHEQFGLDRLCEIVEQNRARPAAQICEELMARVAAWTAAQLDDISLLIARYSSAS